MLERRYIMADGTFDAPSPSESTAASSSPSSAESSSPTSQFYPFATSPDIIRAHEKDLFLTSTLASQAQTIIRALRGARFAHTHSEAIKKLTELLYFCLTTLIGNRTLGEEYCDVVQLEVDTLQLPSIVRRAGYIVSSILVPWLLGRTLPALRARVRARLERSIARDQARATLATLNKKDSAKSSPPSSTALRIKTYLLNHLDSITSLSPIYALHLAMFYFSGAYYHLSKRIWGLRYVFTKRIGESEERVGYEVLGVLMVLQMAVQAILHVRDTLSSLQEQQSQEKTTYDEKRRQEGNLLPSVTNPPSIPSLPADEPRYNLAEDPAAIPWIPEGQQRKCTLCLELFKDPSVTTCGHVFCWSCIRDWVREKAECPLCRQEVLPAKILPVRG
ncbi:hypothetical protein VTN31DRAFT_497 [Thermomyces dupontii]|uniref:uncharacterized protein n=1 Tax=Talaromyces thermophilus TaxID=28565 RepID=UPI003744348E